MAIGVQRIVHVNLNCTDLARSLDFFENVIGLQRTIHTAPAGPQPGGVFGLAEAQWDAWILGGAAGMQGLALDLLQWIKPAPEPSPPRAANHLGLSRLVVRVPDLGAVRRATAAAGSGRSPIVLRDPDGALVELEQGDETQIVSVGVNCSSLDRSVAFYTDLVGLTMLRAPAETTTPEGRWRSAALGGPQGGADAPFVELREWEQPPPEGTPNRVANGVGFFRMALFVADMATAYAGLQAAGVRCVAPPGDLDLGPGVPACSALLFEDPDGTILELIGAVMSSS